MKYVHVPFQGGAPAITAVLGNHVDALVLTLPPMVPQIVQGKLRGLGVASEKRNSAIPDVPTYGEMGFPDVYSGSWVAFFAPGKTPDAVVNKLNAEINAAMKQPEALEKLKRNGFDPLIKIAAETESYFKSEVASWARMVNAVGFSTTGANSGMPPGPQSFTEKRATAGPPRLRNLISIAPHPPHPPTQAPPLPYPPPPPPCRIPRHIAAWTARPRAHMTIPRPRHESPPKTLRHLSDLKPPG